MRFSNGPIDIMGIITLLLPVVTFAMGYYLTGIEHKRELKRRILREKFEKLYHPFYVMINELGTASEEGIAFSAEDSEVIKRFFDHFMTNAYLANTEGQKLFWDARSQFYRFVSDGDNKSKEKEQKLDEAMGALFGHFLMEYINLANALGYELGNVKNSSELTKVQDVKPLGPHS